MNNSIDKLIGNTRLLKIKLLSGKDNSDNNNEIWGKMEGDNPSGSLKDRAALGMILGAEKRKKIGIGDTLIEPTSGNTGISLAMICASRGYKIKLVIHFAALKSESDSIKNPLQYYDCNVNGTINLLNVMKLVI